MAVLSCHQFKDFIISCHTERIIVLHCKNKVVKITNLFVSTVARNSKL